MKMNQQGNVLQVVGRRVFRSRPLENCAVRSMAGWAFAGNAGCSLKAYHFRSGSAMRSSAFGRTGDRNRRRKTAIGTRATCTCRASRSTNITARPSGIPRKLATRTWSPLEGDELGSRPPDGALQEGRRESTFFSMGVHHDNFRPLELDAHPLERREHGAEEGHGGTVAKAARKHGLRFGVSEHLWISYKWFSVSHGADKTGPLAGVPYDGADPNMPTFITMRLRAVHRKLRLEPTRHSGILETALLDRIKDLVDKYQPDLLYTDGASALRGIRAEAGRASLQREREGARRQYGGGLYEQTPEIATTAPALSIIERGVADGSPRTRGRPTLASATGTTSAASNTRRRRRSSTCSATL